MYYALYMPRAETAYHRITRQRIESAVTAIQEKSVFLATPLVGNPSGDMDMKIEKEIASQHFGRACDVLTHIAQMTAVTRKERALRARVRRYLKDLDTVESIA